MRAAMEEPRLFTHRLHAIATDLDQLSACVAEAESMNTWIGSLPMANLPATTAHLLGLVSELPRLRTDYLRRLELLEAIRPTVYYVCARIDRQNAASGIRWNESLEDAQALQRALAHGFKSVVLGALPVAQEDRAAKDALVQALHRALADLSQVYLRFSRHYLAPEAGHWLHLNQLLHIARDAGFAGHKVRDPEHHNPSTTSITDAWLRPALLAIARPNQLRNNELNQLFNALEQWSNQASIVSELGGGSWQVDLFSDRPPLKIGAPPGSERMLTISTDVLAYELEAFLQEIPSTVPVPEYIGEKLLRHLVAVWSRPKSRDHSRLLIADEVEVGIGLRVASACFAREADERREDRRNLAPEPEANTPQPPLATHRTQATDTSPLGFRLLWPEGLPPSAQIGEIVSVREKGQPAMAGRSFEVDRWSA